MVVSLVAGTSCEPRREIVIENQTNQSIDIYYEHVRDDGTLSERTSKGVLPANSVKSFGTTFLGNKWVWRIEAQTSSGEVIFSYDYNIDDLEKINWKITIPP
jgi:hypothetical protein